MRARHVDHLAQVVALRQLTSREMPIHRRIAESVTAIDALHSATKTWTAFAPRRSALDAAVAQADAVARSLRELRIALDGNEQGGSTDA